MNRRFGFTGGPGLPMFEALEDRRLFSLALPTALTPVAVPTPTLPVVASALVLLSRRIHAEVGQSFQAVVGKISGLPKLPAPYSIHGSIDWGDGTATSTATFVTRPDGSIAVLGSHTYSAVGTDAITITLTEIPPPGSLLPIVLVNQIHSTADVISSPGGVTLEETPGTPFTAAVGSFKSKLSGLIMTATIDWGDGTTSIGKILAEPVANPLGGGQFEVIGTHTYATARSCLVHVVVTAAPPPPVTAVSASPPLIALVADIESVVDVVPVSPVATA